MRTAVLTAWWVFGLFTINMQSLHAEGVEIQLPRIRPMHNLHLVSAYPNPFDQYTTLTYRSEKTEFVRIALYTSQGKFVGEIFDDLMEGGAVYQFQLTGEDLESGVYWCSIETKKEILRQKLEIVR